MHKRIVDILQRNHLSKEDIVILLSSDEENAKHIFAKAKEIKNKYLGKYTYFRGLIELSNLCIKDCYYCGIRRSNKEVERYAVSDEEVLKAVKYAMDRDWGSIVIQAGERQDINFVETLNNLLRRIAEISNKKLGITLSLGEQKIEVYQKWHDLGATRYLIRIETSNKELYNKIHPNDKFHDFYKRKQAILDLREVGYMAGTGVMIGLPFQTLEDLADDLLFMQEMDIDMCGMGPYIEHENTPLWTHRNTLLSISERYNLSLKMIAILRILMKDINIASSTALQAIKPHGREEGIMAGANVIMPNITPIKYHSNYNLYKGKPKIAEETDEYVKTLEEQIEKAGSTIGYGTKGDPLHFDNRNCTRIKYF
jgi:biotin synthase